MDLILDIVDVLNEGKFAFMGTSRESHDIEICIPRDSVINSPLFSGNSVTWFAKSYHYQLFILKKDHEIKERLEEIKKGIEECDTIIWRSFKEDDDYYRLRFAAIKDMKQVKFI